MLEVKHRDLRPCWYILSCTFKFQTINNNYIKDDITHFKGETKTMNIYKVNILCIILHKRMFLTELRFLVEAP